MSTVWRRRNTINDSPVLWVIRKTCMFLQECRKIIKGESCKHHFNNQLYTNSVDLDCVCKSECVLQLCYCLQFFFVSGWQCLSIYILTCYEAGNIKCCVVPLVQHNIAEETYLPDCHQGSAPFSLLQVGQLLPSTSTHQYKQTMVRWHSCLSALDTVQTQSQSLC